MIAIRSSSPAWRATVPAEECYWAVLDSTILATHRLTLRGRIQTGLGYLFEDVLPLPIDSVHAVYVALPNRRFLACGVDRDLLRASLESGIGPSQLHVLGPEGVPEELSVELDAQSINLLTGPFEPAPKRRLRAGLAYSLCITIILAAMLTLFGLNRRAGTVEAQIRQTDEARTSLCDQVLGARKRSAGPRDLQLTAEVRRLRQTHGRETHHLEASSIAPSLGEVLARWPRGLSMRTEVITVAGETVTIRGLIPDSGKAQQLARALENVPGWELQQPEFTQVKGAVQVTIRLVSQSSRGRP